MIRKMIPTVVMMLFVMMLLPAAIAFAEYYQYTDENGVVRFTDDISQIPAARRSAVKKFESVTTPTDETTAQPTAGHEEMNAGGSSGAESTVDTVETPEPGTSQMNAVELNKMQSELNETRLSLDKEKSDMEAQKPKNDASSNERIAYSLQVDALNAKIVQYGKDLKAFEEKVTAFNNRKKKVSEAQQQKE